MIFETIASNSLATQSGNFGITSLKKCFLRVALLVIFSPKLEKMSFYEEKRS